MNEPYSSYDYGKYSDRPTPMTMNSNNDDRYTPMLTNRSMASKKNPPLSTRQDPLDHDRYASPIPLPPPMNRNNQVEVFYLDADQSNDFRAPSPPIPTHRNQISPMPPEDTKENYPAVFTIPHDLPSEAPNQQVVVYVLDADTKTTRMDSPIHRERTPSPPIRPMKTQASKASKFPTALHSVPSPPMTQTPIIYSKASESIQRSMDKYRFLGSQYA